MKMRLCCGVGRVFLLFAVACVIVCCTEHRTEQRVTPDTSEFREGDLAFRYGLGIESHVVGVVSDGVFSHVGILHYDEQKGWMVVHAVPGEAPDGEADVVKEEPIDSFYLPMRALRGGWARIDCDSLIAWKATEYALLKAKERVLFDDDYRLSDTTALYCTELVWRSYLAQGLDLVDGKRTTMPAMSTDTEYILPSDIVDSKRVKFLKMMEMK